MPGLSYLYETTSWEERKKGKQELQKCFYPDASFLLLKKIPHLPVQHAEDWNSFYSTVGRYFLKIMLWDSETSVTQPSPCMLLSSEVSDLLLPSLKGPAGNSIMVSTLSKLRTEL